MPCYSLAHAQKNIPCCSWASHKILNIQVYDDQRGRPHVTHLSQAVATASYVLHFLYSPF